MAKAKAAARKSVKRAATRGARQQQAAMPRSMHNRGSGDTRKAVQTPVRARVGHGGAQPAQDSLTRSCASTFSRVESSGAIGTSETTAAMSL